MRRSSHTVSFVAAVLTAGALAIPACGGNNGTIGFQSGSSGGGSGGSSSGGGGNSSSGGGGSSSGSLFNADGGLNASSSGGGSSGGVLPDGGIACPTGLQCNVSCTGGGSTTVTGKVYDPAKKNPLYNVAVYVPAVPLQPLPKGVPTGNDACSCGALFESGALTYTNTAVDGTFTLSNVPVGSQVPLVLQIGKWRRQVNIDVKECTANAQPDKSLSLPGTIAAGDTNDNMPDIAVSTGGADTLECLMLRIGIPAAEYVAGSATTGHVHVFSGGDPGGGGGGGGGLGSGMPEANIMSGAPESDTTLWDSQDHLMPYDVLLLSCEGGETYNANPASLESYLNAGGRAFGSHYHYSWFSGPLSSGQSYAAPADWGNNLATWSDGTMGGGGSGGGLGVGPIGGVIDQTLNNGSGTFQKGQALDQWLGNVGALGQNGVPAAELSIYQPRYNAVVGTANKPSQPWITSDATSGTANQTMFFSFDTPVDAPALPDGGPPNYCGRAVFSDLHVSGNPSINDTENTPSLFGIGGGQPPPAGCDNTDLSPQEKALEFMLFDLSSCVVPDNVYQPPDAGPPPPPAPK